jgi:NAD(P)-dependent dehydrogenase (short-subunit alcohol dehydrogenase family)
MSALDASAMLRPGLLEGVGVLVAGPAAPRAGGESLGDAVAGACAALGAALAACAAPAGGSHEQIEAASDDAVRAALEGIGRIDVLVLDGSGLFDLETAGATDRTDTAGAARALGECLEAAWTLTRSVFNIAFAPAKEGGRVLYLAPSDGAGMHAGAALAGLENLSRTLSIEWARHGVTAVTIATGGLTPASEVAALAAYLASPAGAYFSGCLLDLRGPRGSAAHSAE